MFGRDAGTTTATGGGTEPRPECVEYVEGVCACGYQGTCREEDREHYFTLCAGFFDSAPCVFDCYRGSASCEAKSACYESCEG